MKIKKTPEQKQFWAQVDRCVKEVRSWPKWKQVEAEQWHKQLRRDQEIMREYRETQGQQ